MPKYSEKAITSKIGVNYVKSIVEGNGSIFQKIDLENDLGIDGIIEFIENGKPTNKQIAVQIKTGNSFFDSKKSVCRIPVEDHFEYWINYSLPVFGIVYIPTLEKAHWVNIKNYLKGMEKCSIIKFETNKTNTFDTESYNKIFKPLMLQKYPMLSFEEALTYFNSNSKDDFITGMHVLFRKYINEKQTWTNFIEFIKNNESENIPYSLLFYIAHIPWHSDIFYTGEDISIEIKDYAKSLIKVFDEKMIIKLLSIIDEEEGIERGTIGQSIEAIISIIDENKNKMKLIIKNSLINSTIRYFAALIFSFYYYTDSECLPLLIKYESEIPNTGLLIELIKTNDGVFLY